MSKNIILCCILPVIIGVPFIRQHEANEISDGGSLTGTEIAVEGGYPAESYEVVTQDGYILRLERITGSKKCPPSENKTAVLLLHGILDASPTWLVAVPERALAMIDHIIEQTKQEKIFMVSHSQGTTSFFVMASERPEYQEKLIASFALAPVAFLSRIENPLLQLIATFSGDIYVRFKT
ncbi:Lipase 3 [Melipona quadrifasciata]|uniref:Lipase 3 n=1 Tax=Melipona quadrifasciata TaxID=166423 RepID=A0A0M9A8A7_9HYME|nr:Lipase 3 [Melipona quadrifasciata]